MAITREEIQDLVGSGDLTSLFLKRLHWDNPSRSQPDLYGSEGLIIPGTDLIAYPVASKRVVDLWHVPYESMPPRTAIRKTVTTLRKRHSLEMLVVFEADDGQLLWLWPEQRRTGNGFQLVEHSCNRNSLTPKMLDQLYDLRFDPEKEEQLTSTTVLEKVRVSLDVDLAGLEMEVKSTIASAVGHLSSDGRVSEQIGEILCQEASEQTNMMATAILFNAVVFQHHIADRHEGIPTPDALRRSGLKRVDVEAAWKAVLDINYWPIFGIARDLLAAISDDAAADKVLKVLYGRAAETTAHRDTQGIIGELYGRLVADRAFLKTHFTRLGSAAFLAELAVDRLAVEWADPEEVTRLRVADLACGTGALLTAAYRRIAARHDEAGGEPASIHKKMMEEVLIGCDIMPASVHLTAAMLSGEHPGEGYRKTQTWTMPYGRWVSGKGTEFKLGSLDLLGANQTRSLFGDGTERVTSMGAPSLNDAWVPEGGTDLIVMNPPFTRPTNHEGKAEEVPNPAFAGLGTDAESQEQMSKALKSTYRRIKYPNSLKNPRSGHGNAGIATNFIDLANGKLKAGGILAFIVPASVVSGSAWRNTRGLLAEQYEKIEVVTLSSITDGEARAFSDDTGMAEAIIVATKRKMDALGDPDNGEARYISLRERPSDMTAGIDMARAVREEGELDRAGNSHLGFALPSRFSRSGDGSPIGLESPELANIAIRLQQSYIRLPQISGLTSLPMTSLGELGHRGPVCRDINELGAASTPRGPYDVIPPDRRWIRRTPVSERRKVRRAHAEAQRPVLWSHDLHLETSMVVYPCSTGFVRPGMDDRARELWVGYRNAKDEVIAGATRLHINNDFRLNSQSTAACLTPVPSLGGRAWPSFQPEPPNPGDRGLWEKALCVWLNSTLGLLGRWWVSSRQQGGRANLSITAIGNIPVLDIRELTSIRLEHIAGIFDDFADRDFLPANEAYRDPARADLDRAIAKKVLYLPDAAVEGIRRLRLMWCSEPSVHGNKRTQPGGPAGN